MFCVARNPTECGMHREREDCTRETTMEATAWAIVVIRPPGGNKIGYTWLDRSNNQIVTDCRARTRHEGTV